MKKIDLALIVLIAASLGGNFYLYGNNRAMQQQLAQQQEQIAQLTAQAEEADTTIEDLQTQLQEAQALVVDAPEQAGAEQSTQGATDKVTPQAPDPDKDYSNMSGNDLLEEILGNNNMPSGGTSSGDYSSDKPGMGWNNITDSDPNAEADMGTFDPSLWE